MIKRVFFYITIFGAINSYGQSNQMQFSNINLGNQMIQQRVNNPVVLASNVINTSNVSSSNKVAPTNISRHRTNLQKSVPNTVVNRRPPIQQHANPRAQLINQIDAVQLTNVGNDFEINAIQVQQDIVVELPAIKTESGSMTLELRMPKMNLTKNSIKINSKSNSSRYKILQLENKLKKVNRKLSTKLNSKKRLKFKVDNCFKW